MNQTPLIMKNNIKNIIIGLLAITLIIFIIISKHRANKITNLEGQNTLLTQSIDSFKNKKGQTITEQQTAIFTNDNIIKEQSKEIFDLTKKNERLIKQVNALVQIKQQVRIDTAFVPYLDTITKYITTNTDSLIQVPKRFAIYDSAYTIAGQVLKHGVYIDSFAAMNQISLRIANKSQGWFKPQVSVVQVVNNNESFKVTGVTSAVVQTPTSEWNKWAKPLLAAIAASFITYQLTK